MSASEKLKALEERLADLEHWFPDGIAAQQAYIAALPQIVAVVEATTNAHAVWTTAGVCEESTQQSLRAALVALDEELP